MINYTPNLISVLLPVRNGMPFIKEALASILNQNINNWELIVINDGSTDETSDWLNMQDDPRLRILDTGGVGLVNALNFGLKYCRGEFIARMDADDVAEPNRFELQIACLSEDSSVGVVCTDIICIDEQGKKIGEEVSCYNSNEYIKKGLLYQIKFKPIIHPSVIFRREALMGVHGYRSYSCSEDRDLWLRLIDDWRIVRLNKKLLRYRITPNGISRARRSEQMANSMMASINYVFNKSENIDLYIKKEKIWIDMLKICAQYSDSQNKAIEDFDKIKQAVRSGNIFHAVYKVVVGIFEHGLKIFPKYRDRCNFKFIMRWNKILAKLV